MALQATELLRAFESRDVVAQAAMQATGRELRPEHAYEIASHITQSRQYLDAANEAGELVRPLLVYYACLSLAKAVVMFRTRRREAALSQGHGLCTEDWSKTLASGLGDFLNLSLSVSRGTFADLAAATENVDRISYMVPMGVFETMTIAGSPTLPPAAKFRVGNIWHRIPRLRPLIMATHGSSFDCWPAFAFRHAGHDVHVELCEVAGRVPSEAEARRMMGLAGPAQIHTGVATANGRYRVEMLGPGHGYKTLHILVPCPTDEEFRQAMAHFKTDGVNQFVVEPIAPDLKLSTLCLLFAAAFAAGMLVRYHPTTWQRLVRGDKGDRALVVLRKSVELAEGGFPTMALEAMLQPPSVAPVVAQS